MFRDKTVFILGAGASKELNLPLGEGLKADILAELKPSREFGCNFTNRQIDGALQEILRNEPPHQWSERQNGFAARAERMMRALPIAPSIDNFLHVHQDDVDTVLLGKLGIAAAILKAEEKSFLRREPKQQERFRAEFLASWCRVFWQLLCAGVTKAEIKNLFSSVAFIVFNYDRCLEVMLMQALAYYYDLEATEIRDIMSEVSIVHPYGQVGSFPGGLNQSVAFGQTQCNLLAVSSQIRTFTETVADGVAEQVQSVIQSAETLVFLGFAFHEQNMDLMKVERSNVRRIFGTGLDISPEDQIVVKYALREMLGGFDERGINRSPFHEKQVLIEQKEANQLLHHFRFNLTRQ